MIFSLREEMFFGKYLRTENAEKQTNILKVEPSDIPEEDKKRLIDYDEVFYMVKGYHIIVDYDRLREDERDGKNN